MSCNRRELVSLGSMRCPPCFSCFRSGLVWTAAVLLRRFCFGVWSGLRRCFSAAFVSGLVWTAAVLLRCFCFYSFPVCREDHQSCARRRKIEEEKQKRHRNTAAIQTKTRNKSGGEAPPQ